MFIALGCAGGQNIDDAREAANTATDSPGSEGGALVEPAEPNGVPTPSVDPEGELLAVTGPDAITGEPRIWLVDTHGARRELTPLSGTSIGLFSSNGELILVSHEPTEDLALVRSFHRVSGNDILPPASLFLPPRASGSHVWSYSARFDVQANEQHTYEDGTIGELVSGRLSVFDGVDQTATVITDNVPTFAYPTYAPHAWSPVRNELLYLEATNDDVENPTWEVRFARIDADGVSEPVTVLENGVYPFWSADGRWVTLTTLDRPWVIDSLNVAKQHWLVEPGTGQRHDLGAVPAGQDIYWTFFRNVEWMLGQRVVSGEGPTEMMYRRIPDGETITIARATADEKLSSARQLTDRPRAAAVELRDANNVLLRSYYADFALDEPEIVIVEGEHEIWWPGRGDLVVTYQPDEPGAVPGPDTTGTAKVYRILPKPENLLFELRLNYWLRASAADAHFVFRTEAGWFSIAAEPGAEPVALSLGDQDFRTTNPRLHPESALVAFPDPTVSTRVHLLSWPNGKPLVQQVDFPELEFMMAPWWVVPTPHPVPVTLPESPQ